MLLRYPGGKSRGPLKKRIIEHITSSNHGGWFGEPFFGGGAITIQLLKDNLIDRVVLAEADPSLLALWTDIVFNPKRLIKQVRRVTPTVDLFLRRKAKVLNGSEDGVDALIVNRLSHGGRGVCAGPQGGVNQNGKYKIGCRWNPDKLVKTINELHELFSVRRVQLFRDYRKVDATFMYVDPPYYEVGNDMYMCSFKPEDHQDLFDWLSTRSRWLLSYNNHPAVLDLYEGYDMLCTGTHGNGGMKPNSELLIWRD